MQHHATFYDQICSFMINKTIFGGWKAKLKGDKAKADKAKFNGEGWRAK